MKSGWKLPKSFHCCSVSCLHRLDYGFRVCCSERSITPNLNHFGHR
nr:MAG TPA: hypothetical protein [Caudoviricetes sp.]